MKFISKALPDIALSTLKSEFDAIAEDCSLLDVSVSGENTLILTVDTDLVVTLVINSSTALGSTTSVVFNGNSFASRSSNIGSNPVLRVLYTESFFYCIIKGMSYNIWWTLEKLDGNKFANGNINTGLNDYFDMRTRDNAGLSRIPTVPHTNSRIGTLDYVEKTVLITATTPYTDVAYDTNFYVCSTLGFYDKILTIDNKDYYVLTPHIIAPIDDE